MTRLRLDASVAVPASPRGAVLVAHTGPAGKSQATVLADVLHHSGLATLVVDLLTREERSLSDRALKPERIAHRASVGLGWFDGDSRTRGLPIGGLADAGCAAGLLVACARASESVIASACLGGCPDRAGEALTKVLGPVLLLAGEHEPDVLTAARDAQRSLCVSELGVIEDTTAIADDPDALLVAAHLVRDWFVDHLASEAH